MPEETSTEVTGDVAAEQAPTSTPENVEVPEVADEPEVETPEVETEEESPTPETETESAPEKEVESTDVDDLSDLEASPIPTKEEIGKLRIKPEEKARLNQVAELAEVATKQLDEIGGEFGVKAFSPLAKLYTKATATDAELGIAVASMVEANPTVTSQFLTGGAQFLLSQPQLGTPLLQSVFGDNASIDNVKALLALDSAGYFDKDDASQFLRDGVPGTEVYQNQVAENERLTQELADIKSAINDPAKLQELRRGTQAVNGEKAVKAFEGDFYSETPTVLKSLFDRVNWGDGPHAKLVTELLQRRLRDDPSYLETEKYLHQTGVYQDGDSRVGMANANLTILKNKLHAQAIEAVRELQADFRRISENSRNAKIVKEKEVAKAPKTEAPAPNGDAPKFETHEQRQARIDAKFKENLRAERAAMGAAQGI